MENLLGKMFRVLLVIVLILLVPAILQAESERQPEQATVAPPPIEQELVREGSFAVKLASELGIASTEDEAEAESRLAEAGIAPGNGWIADYPVTPDIVSELREAVNSASDTPKLPMGQKEAQMKFDAVVAGFNLHTMPYSGEKKYRGAPAGAQNYPDPEAIEGYYDEEGPPVVTYYVPPPAYYYLYSWVPYPFWWFGFWFPGFFILNDFHRIVVVNNNVVFISNHFNDFRTHRVFRIDPVSRFRGRTFAGIGAPRTRGFINTGVPRSGRTIFNAPRTRSWPGTGMGRTSTRGRGSIGIPPPSGGRRMGAPPSTRGMEMKGIRPQGGRISR